MQNISIYLEKFKDLGLKESQTKDMVVEVAKDVANINISREDVQYKDGEVSIQTSGTAKASIFLNKEKILRGLKKRLDKGVYDIH